MHAVGPYNALFCFDVYVVVVVVFVRAHYMRVFTPPPSTHR
jgi:hypothetical protein